MILARRTRVISTGAPDLVEQRSGATLAGTILAGRYVLGPVLGTGGMGTVYRAEQTALGRTVAVKLLHPYLRDEASVARFYEEARVASRLNHPNTVAVIDFGVTETGCPYLVMEYLDGTDLGAVLSNCGAVLSTSRICHILRGVLGALAEAHDQGIVHRDLKPENILLARYRDGTETVKVVDFGLAQVRSTTVGSRPLTQPGTVVGTPQYMPPEQFSGDDLDGRSDLYALGVVMFELLTGRLPFLEESLVKLGMQHFNDAPPDPRSVAPGLGIPPPLGRIALRAMAKAKEDRFQSAREMAAAVERAYQTLRARDSWRAAASGMHRVVPGGRISPPTTLTETLGRLDLPQRILVQAAAVLGTESTLHAVGAVAGGADPAALAGLVEVGLVDEVTETEVRFDPPVRRLIEETIPREARRELHDRALAWHAHIGSPLAIRADHAFRGSDPIAALVLLEQLGDVSTEEGELARATQAYQRGLHTARTELAGTGDDAFDYAVATFGRKLAAVLRLQGRVAEAEGVLREALDLTAPSSRERERLVAALTELQQARIPTPPALPRQDTRS